MSLPASTPQAGSQLEVVAGGIDEQGRGAVRLEGGGELVVPGLLPAERALVLVEHRSRQSGRLVGRVLQLLDRSADRCEPRCPHQASCGGCPLGHASTALQLRAKRELLRSRFSIEVDELVAVPERAWGYRLSAKRVVGGRSGALVLGSYLRGSHQLTSMQDCQVDHPDVAACAREVERVGSALGLEPYEELHQRGDLRYLWLKSDGRGRVLVTLVAAGAESQAPELGRALSLPAGVAWCVQAATGNAMRGHAVQQLVGLRAIEIAELGERATVGPLGFMQPNPRVAALAYRDLVGEECGQLACDLYAGAGITTAALRRGFDRVLVAEAFAESAQALGTEPRPADELLAALLAEPGGTPVDLITANPPRAGLGERVCALLSRLQAAGRGPARLRVMSCHPAAMARDIARLTGVDGSFRLLWARAYDTLPHTAHVELVVAFEAARHSHSCPG